MIRIPLGGFHIPLNSCVTLGRSGLRVSPFCLGTMTFGEEVPYGSNVQTANGV